MTQTQKQALIVSSTAGQDFILTYATDERTSRIVASAGSFQYLRAMTGASLSAHSCSSPASIWRSRCVSAAPCQALSDCAHCFLPETLSRRAASPPVFCSPKRASRTHQTAMVLQQSCT